MQFTTDRKPQIRIILFPYTCHFFRKVVLRSNVMHQVQIFNNLDDKAESIKKNQSKLSQFIPVLHFYQLNKDQNIQN